MISRKLSDQLLKNQTHVVHNWPANISEADEHEFSDEKEYDTEKVYLKYLENIWVSSDSVAYRNFNLIQETLAAPAFAKYYRVRHLIKNYLFGKKIRIANSTKCLLVTDSWSAGHFHWLTEVLPKLLLIRERSSEFSLLLPDLPYIRKIGLQSLESLQFHFADIIWMKNGEFYKIKNLYYINNFAPSGRMNKEQMKELGSELRGGKSGRKRRIYLSRSKAKFRKILNEDQLTGPLRNLGFDIIHAEDYSFSEQQEIFSSCEILAGMHGAGLTNAIFMREGSGMLEIRKRENGPHNVGYWHLADSMGQKYYYHNGIPDSDLPLVGRGCNLTVRTDDLGKILESMIEQ